MDDKQEHNDVLTDLINQKLKDQYFINMESLAGKETAELGAFIAVLRDQLQKQIDECPNFWDNMNKLEKLQASVRPKKLNLNTFSINQ